MAYITPAQEALVRSQKQNTKLYLSIYQPDTLLACQVNDATITKGERSLTYDGVTTGNYLSVQSGMSLLVGTSAGSDDKGRIRVRSITDTVITVAENGHINWADDDYLTVVNYYEINAVYPRIIQDPANELNTIWYKDYDVAYTNQNNILGSMICMGSHYAGLLDGAGNHQVYYSASGTHNMFDETLSYHWFFEGADTTGSSSETPGWVTYSDTGHFTSTLIVSGTTNGAVDKSHRHVSIYDRPENGTTNPILNWEFDDFSGDRTKGGYTGKIKIHESVDSSLLKNGSLIVIFNESWYEDNKNIIGGNGLNRGNIFFAGYVISGTITYNYRESSVEFVVGSPSEIMKLTETYVIEVEDSTDPAAEAISNDNHPTGWTLLKGLNLERSIYHYLRWHSTALECMDFQYLGSDVNTQYFRSDLTSVFDTLNSTMNTANWGNAVCDRQGKMWFETPIWYSNDTSYFATNVGITSQDWIGEPSISEVLEKQVSFVNVGGVAWSGAATGSYGAFLCDVPGTAPAYRGNREKKPSLAVSSQTQLNTIAGDYFANVNATYPDIFMQLRGGYLHYDIAPQEFVPITVNTDETVRGINFVGKNFYPQTLNYTYDPKSELLLSSPSLKEHTSGFAGDTRVKPPVPTDSETGGSYSTPTFEFPPFPALPSFNLGVTSLAPVYSTADTAVEDFGTTVVPYDWITYGSLPMVETLYTTAMGSCIIPANAKTISVYVSIRTGVVSPVSEGDVAYDWILGTNEFSSQISSNKAISGEGTFTIPYSFFASRKLVFLLGTATLPTDLHSPGVGIWNFTRYGGIAADTYEDMGFNGMYFTFT